MEVTHNLLVFLCFTLSIPPLLSNRHFHVPTHSHTSLYEGEKFKNCHSLNAHFFFLFFICTIYISTLVNFWFVKIWDGLWFWFWIFHILKFHCMYWTGVEYFYIFSHHKLETRKKPTHETVLGNRTCNGSLFKSYHVWAAYFLPQS